MWSSANVHRYGRCSRAACLHVEHVSIWLLKLPLILIAVPGTLVSPSHQVTASFSCARVLLLSDLPDLPGTSAKLGCQPPAFAKRLQQTVRSHDGLHALHGHIAHAAKTGHCDSPILIVLACRFWLHTCIHAFMHSCIHAYIHTCMPSLSHTIFLCHTPSFTYGFVPHNCFYFSILHHLLFCFLPSPSRYNICCSLLEEVDMWGYPVL